MFVDILTPEPEAKIKPLLEYYYSTRNDMSEKDIILFEHIDDHLFEKLQNYTKEKEMNSNFNVERVI